MFNRNQELLGIEVLKAQSVSETLRRFGSYFAKYKIALGITALFVIVSTVLSVSVPLLLGQVVDCYLDPLVRNAGSLESCWYTTIPAGASDAELYRGLGGIILLILGIYITTSTIIGSQFFAMSWAGAHVLRDIRDDVFRHVHRLSLSFFSRNEAGDIMSRFTNDTDTLQQIMGFGLVQVISGLLQVIFVVLAMFFTNLPFAIVGLITLPLMFLVTRWLSELARRAFREARKEIGAVNADLQENIASVREVQAFSREQENIAEFESVNAANRDANIRAQAYSSALAPALEALVYINIAIVAGVGGLTLLGDGDFFGTLMTIGVIVTFISFAQQLNRPVQQIALLWTNLQSAIAGGERIFGLLDEDPDISDKPNAGQMPEIRGEVTLSGVHAEYNKNEPVLRGVNIHAQPGQTVAIVGPTGAGKTTIINLLPRFWDVSAGSVKIDGIDVRDVTRASLRSQIGIVLQDTFLFSDTVMNNIRYGRPEASDDEVIEAAKLARADQFITKMSDGYDTVLGERGTGLSQGQRQLLSIARVMLMDPQILIMDEATSSVDTRTEREIQSALDKLLAGRTSFVIAHRLSTIRNADQVIVLRDGAIIEQGTHNDLLEAGGFYHGLYMSQFRRSVAEKEPQAAD